MSARGHDLRAPSLAGMGEHAAPPQHRQPVSLGQWRDQLVSQIELEDLREVVLLGHSQGGLVVRSVAPHISDRLCCVGYLDAPVPAPGQRGVDLMGAPPDQLPPADTWLEPTPLDADEHHSRALVEWINPRLCATPLRPSLDPLGEDPVTVPEHVAFCAHTPAHYPSSLYRGELDRSGATYEVIDAPHDSPLTHPGEVADWLESIGTAT